MACTWKQVDKREEEKGCQSKLPAVPTESVEEARRAKKKKLLEPELEHAAEMEIFCFVVQRFGGSAEKSVPLGS